MKKRVALFYAWKGALVVVLFPFWLLGVAAGAIRCAFLGGLEDAVDIIDHPRPE